MWLFWIAAFLLGVDGLDRLDKSFSHGMTEIGIALGVGLIGVALQVYARTTHPRGCDCSVCDD
jgi:hypothetical protein